LPLRRFKMGEKGFKSPLEEESKGKAILNSPSMELIVSQLQHFVGSDGGGGGEAMTGGDGEELTGGGEELTGGGESGGFVEGGGGLLTGGGGGGEYGVGEEVAEH
jgi:hypothetical protein